MPMFAAVHAWALCILSAGLYVGSMYVIPLRIRRLPRDNVVHVRNNFLYTNSIELSYTQCTHVFLVD